MSQRSAAGRLSDKCVPLGTLDLETLKFDQGIYDRCGMLALHLVDVSTGEEVGFKNCHTCTGWSGSRVISTQVAGVVFNLLDNDEIERLEKNQAKIKALTTKLKRRNAFSDWNYGEMRAVGSRQPSGGRAGDGYAPYPSTKILTKEDVHTLFEHAAVCVHPSFLDIDVLA